MMQIHRRFLLMTALAASAFVLTTISARAATLNKPNVVFLLVDDLGIKDLPATGVTFTNHQTSINSQLRGYVTETPMLPIPFAAHLAQQL